MSRSKGEPASQENPPTLSVGSEESPHYPSTLDTSSIRELSVVFLPGDSSAIHSVTSLPSVGGNVAG